MPHSAYKLLPGKAAAKPGVPAREPTKRELYAMLANAVGNTG